MRCPKCGTLNPVGNLFCDNCNTRLVHPEDTLPPEQPSTPEGDRGSAAVKGISLPTRSSAAEEDASSAAALPDWLSGLIDEDAEFGAEDASPESATDFSYDPDTLPDWLMGEEDEGPAGADTELPSTEPLPDWLGGISEQATPGQEPAESETELPDWLAELTTEPPETEMASESDDTIEESEPDLPETGSELPDWLAELTASAEMEMPPESDDSIEESEPDLLEAGAELPDWLTEMTGPVVPETDAPPAANPFEEIDSSEASEPDPLETGAELPDWLTEMTAPTLSEAETSFQSETIAETSSDEETAPELPEAGPELPDWLMEVSDEDAGQAELPQWLTDLTETPAMEPSAESAEAAEPVAEEEPAEAALTEPEPTPEPENVPDWLAELDVSRSQGPQANIFSDEEQDTEAPVAAETPSWLQDLQPAEEPVEGSRSTPAFLDLEPPEEPEEDEIPGLTLEGPEEIPEWLQGVDFTSPAEMTPEVLAPSEGDLAPAEVPSWLQELAPPEAIQMSQDAQSVASFGDLAPADIPDWVEALRPEPQEGQERPLERAVLPTPAEPEGPLKGISGVLPSLITVDVPSDARLSVAASIPDSVVAQARLWQQLLEQPRSAERPVSQERVEPAGYPRIVRWLVAAILLLATFAAFWLLPENIRLSKVPGSDVAPGVAPFVENLGQLQAGDRVILATEYTPGYAEEMAQIAAPILDQLNARDAEVLVVSTIPQGVGLSYALSPQPRNRIGLPGSSYIAGNVTGIAEFLSQPEARTATRLIILTSDPQRLRWWIEQNALLGSSELPLDVGVSAAAGALVTPYLRTQSVTGWVSGFPQALAYREMTGIGSNQAYARILDVLTLAQWVAAGLLLVALVYHLFDRKGAN